MFSYIFLSLVFVILFMRITMILYEDKGYFRWLYHDIFHWHIPDEATAIKYAMGHSNYAVCKYCGRAILKDSQGNWI